MKKKRKLTKTEARKVRNAKRFFKRCISVICAFAFMCATVAVALNAFVCGYSKQLLVSTDDLDNMEFDCILILGAGIKMNAPTDMLAERLDFGIEAYNTGCAPKLLMSGDHGRKDYDEVNVMKKYAVDAGIDADDIFMDHAGFSTYESMYRARDVFGVKKVLIVTQKYHIFRAVYDARRLGLDAYGLPADLRKYNPLNECRECLARIKDVIWCTIKPEPTYLGDFIDISASGSQTDDKIQNENQ